MEEQNYMTITNDEHYESLNHLKKIFYETSKSKGRHSESTINIGNFICNIHGEASELFESYRAGTMDLPCDKSDKMLEICGETLNVDISRAVRIKNLYNMTRAHRHGGKIC